MFSKVLKAIRQTFIIGKAEIASVIHIDRWRGYDGLVDMGSDKYLKVNHCKTLFAKGNVHADGVESFWS